MLASAVQHIHNPKLQFSYSNVVFSKIEAYIEEIGMDTSLFLAVTLCLQCVTLRVGGGLFPGGKMGPNPSQVKKELLTPSVSSHNFMAWCLNKQSLHCLPSQHIPAQSIRHWTLFQTYVCIHTYLLTPWSRVLLEKQTGFAANQEIPRILWNP